MEEEEEEEEMEMEEMEEEEEVEISEIVQPPAIQSCWTIAPRRKELSPIECNEVLYRSS